MHSTWALVALRLARLRPNLPLCEAEPATRRAIARALLPRGCHAEIWPRQVLWQALLAAALMAGDALAGRVLQATRAAA